MNLNNFGKSSTEQLQEIEKALDIKLPEDYKRFLLKYNGGIVEKDEFNSIKIPDLSENIVIDVLFGNVDEKNANILFWNEELKEDLFENALIIGDDILQGMIVLICSGNSKGIYYWDDAYNFESSNDDSNMYLIADDFTNFMKLLGNI